MTKKRSRTPSTLRLLREAHSLTQGDLGEKVGIGPTTVSLIERGYYKPSQELLRRFADALGYDGDLDDLLRPVTEFVRKDDGIRALESALPENVSQTS